MSTYLDSLTVEGLISVTSRITAPTSTAATASGTLTLTSASTFLQFITGSASAFTVKLPSALTLNPGHRFEIINTNSQSVQITDGSGANLILAVPNSVIALTLQTSGSVAGGWVAIGQTTNATGITNYNVISSTPFSTTSATDVVITGFTVTPVSGTYLALYSASVLMSTSPVVHNWTIYGNGSAIADSNRGQQTARSNQIMTDSTQTVVVVNGSQAVDVRVNTAGGTLTVNQRSLILVRTGA